jgi:hypothetical protein
MMLDHSERRRLLYNAVTLLEPLASGVLIQHYVALRHHLILPLLRIYVDLERLTLAGHLVRFIRPRLGGVGTTFFWETPGLVLVARRAFAEITCCRSAAAPPRIYIRGLMQ